MRIRSLRDFFQLESSGGIVLFVMAILALIIDNTALHPWYHNFISYEFGFVSENLYLKESVEGWVNDGLMVLFFLLVGLEIKREILEGELDTRSKAMLPAIAGAGGMLLPALIFWGFNHADNFAMRGWAIPCATDIAFSLAILTLLGKRVPWTLRIFLTALAIFDDLGAILIIAFFYTKKISLPMLAISALLSLGLLALNRLRVMRIWPYLLIGFFLWITVFESGVHATLAGIIIACAIPVRDNKNPTIDLSPLRKLEYSLHPWIAFGVLPIFAFVNAGVSLTGLTLNHLIKPIPVGIAVGLFVGKQLGIFGSTWLAIRTGIGRMPHGANWLGLYAVSIIAGVGFTMSLFIGNLAYYGLSHDYKVYVRIGVIIGSVLSGLVGYALLRIYYSKSFIEKRQLKNGHNN